MSQQPEDVNPYQAPKVDTPSIVRIEVNETDRIIRQFHQQILALGVAWIVIAIASMLITLRMHSVAAFFAGQFSEYRLDLILYAIFSALFGVILLPTGLLTIGRNLTAVRFGMVASCGLLILQLVTLNLCGVIIFILVILQAYRVSRWGAQLRVLKATGAGKREME